MAQMETGETETISEPELKVHLGVKSPSWTRDLLKACEKINDSDDPVKMDLKVLKAEILSIAGKWDSFYVSISDSYPDFEAITQGKNSSICIDIIQLANGKYVISIKEWARGARKPDKK